MIKLDKLKKITTTGVLAILIAGTLDSAANSAPIIDAPSTPVPTRVLVNPSFEAPSFTGSTWYSIDNYQPGEPTTLQGWFSTHPTENYAGYNNSRFRHLHHFEHLVEIWANSFQGVPASEGTQFAELNAQADSALYQDILVFAGEEVPWLTAHRGRGSSSVADIAEVFISDPNDWTGPTFSGTKLYSAQISTAKDGDPSGIVASIGSAGLATETPLSSGWVQYSDTWSGPNSTKEYRFAFQSISTGSGNNTIGNFLDDIQIELSPIVDLVNPNISEIGTQNNSVYYLPVRLNGNVQSQATIEIDVSINGSDFSNYTLNTLVSGTDGTLPSGTTATKLNNGNIELTVPADIYDPNNPSQYISIPVDFVGQVFWANKLANFSIVSVTGGGNQGSLELMIPPSDSGFQTSQQTDVLPTVISD